MIDLPESHRAPRIARPLAIGDVVTLDAAHVAQLRLRDVKPKEAFTLVDARGMFFRATLRTLEPRGGEALVYEAMPASPESPIAITLVCAVLARQRMMTVVQKATELGVTRIVPAITERSVQAFGLEHEKAHAWPGQIVRAARQCRRATLPELRAAMPLAMALDDASFLTADRRVYLDDRVAVTPPLAKDAAPRSLVLVVGPEGGFTQEECAGLEARGVLPLRLGGRVLRAETAVLVGITVLQHVFGDM